ncbi:MAG: YbfB/YjiJ family MFS transporter [Mesorhizobium sp.]
MVAKPSPLRDAIAGMLAMAVAMGIGRFVYTPLLPGMMEGLGLTASAAGLVASANFIGYLAGALAAAGGWAAGHERRLMLAALLASALLAAAMATTGSLAAFLVIRFAAGVASAFVLVFATTIVTARLAAAGRGSLRAVHFGGVGLGIAASAVMTGLLVLDGAPWQAGWLWAGGLSLAGFAAVTLLAPQGSVVAAAGRAEGRLARSPALARMILAYGLFGFGYIVTATFLVAIVRESGGGRLFEQAVWLVAGLAGIPSVALWGAAVPRLGVAGAFAAGAVLEAAGVVASVSLGGVAGPLLGALLLGATFIALTAFGLEAGRRLAPEAPRRVLALMTAAFGIGQILGPLAAGLLADWSGSFVLPSLVAAAVLLLAAASAWGAGRDSRLS